MRKLIVVASMVAVLGFPLDVGAQAPAQVPLAATPAQIDRSVFTSPTVGPVVASGTLADAGGRHVSGRVAVFVWPNDAYERQLKVGDSFTTPTVGWTTAGADGSFSLRVDAAKVGRNYLRADGSANLTAIGWTSSSQGSWSFTASLKGSAGATTQAERSGAGAAQIQIKAASQLTVVGSNSAANSSSTSTGAAPPIADTPICSWILQSTWNAYTIIGQTTPWGADTGKMNTDISTTTTAGLATSVGGTYGSWTASGSYEFTQGVNIDWDLSTYYRNYQLVYNFGKYVYCGTFSYMTHARYGTGGYATGGISWANYSHCQPAGAGANWSRYVSNGNHYKNSIGVQSKSILGIDLSLDQNYDSTHTLTYHIATNEHICGDNADPSVASNVSTEP